MTQALDKDDYKEQLATEQADVYKRQGESGLADKARMIKPGRRWQAVMAHGEMRNFVQARDAHGFQTVISLGRYSMNLSLYLLTVLIWGTTWIAIKLQMGEVALAASIAYRFALCLLYTSRCV